MSQTKTNIQTWTSGEANSTCSELSLAGSHQRLLQKGKGSRELHDFQGCPPLGTRVSHSNAQEIKPAQQSDDKAFWWSSETKESAQKVGVGVRAQRQLHQLVNIREHSKNTVNSNTLWPPPFSGEGNFLFENCLESLFLKNSV